MGRIMKRLENVTQIPSDNFEDFQMLKYEVGQFYKLHHDYIDHQTDRLCGPRVLTFFLYLSDVDEGGETKFTKLLDKEGNTLSIMPKKGGALLWPNVRDDEVGEIDPRTHHEAVTV